MNHYEEPLLSDLETVRLTALFRSTYFWTLPVAVFGSSARNVKPCGALKWAMVARELPQLFCVAAAPRFQHHERVRCLAPPLVRQPHDRDLVHGRVAQQHSLRPPPKRCSRRR